MTFYRPQKSFRIFIDHALYHILAFKINNNPPQTISNFNLDQYILNNHYYAVITNDEVILEDICSLGCGIFNTMHKWNHIVTERELDTELLTDIAFIDFDYNYGLIKKIKEVNLKTDNNTTVKGLSTFTTSVNYDNNQFELIDKYNFQFDTKFKVTGMKTVGELSYATIEVRDVDLIDVLGLGFMICLDDVLKTNLSAQYS